MAFEELDFSDKQFWPRVLGVTKGSNIGQFKTSSGVVFVTLQDKAVMKPIVRSKEEYFDATLKRAQVSEEFLVCVNAQLYDISTQGKVDYAIGNDAVDPKFVKPIGRSILNKNVLAGRTSDLMFYIRYMKNNNPRYSFGFGPAPLKSDAAIGGAGPIIINGRPYAPKNVYDKNVPKGAPETGEPSPKFHEHLVYRSNSTYGDYAARDARTGKLIVCHSRANGILAIVVQPNATVSRAIDDFRYYLYALKFDNAVFFDGSDSVTLLVRDKFIVQPAKPKNMTNISGIGFKYE